MMPIKNVSCKICFIGDGGVGKTSLIGRYVYDIFDNKYLSTIGTKVTRKELILDYPDDNVRVKVNSLIWDIMGQKAFRAMLRDAYFHGANGIIGVCSLTDEDSLQGLDDWVEQVKAVVGNVPMVLLANKSDLSDEVLIEEKELKKMAFKLKAPYIFTSAKSGENVSNAFSTIAYEMIKLQLNLS